MFLLWLHRFYFLTVLVYVTLGSVITRLGTTGVAVFCLISIAYILLSRRFYWYPSLALFSLLGIFYIGLSYADILPDSWTVWQDSDYILRQSYFVIMLYPFILAGHIMWEHIVHRGTVGRVMLLCFFCLLVLSPALEILTFTEYRSHFGLQAFFFYGLTTSELLLWTALCYGLLIAFPQHRWIAVPFLSLLLLAVAQTAQVALMAPALLLFAFTPVWFNRWALRLLMVSLILACGIAAIQAEKLIAHDVNMALRAYYWRDAFQALMESHLIGIGFGKEATTNYYPALGILKPFTLHDYMVHGIHNSFFSMFLRMGFLGGALFSWFFTVECFPSSRLHPAIYRHACAILFAAFVGCLANMEIESPKGILGVCLILSYLLACNRIARTHTHEMSLATMPRTAHSSLSIIR